MYCTACGKMIPDDSLFCPECGAPLPDEPVFEEEQPETSWENTQDDNGIYSQPEAAYGDDQPENDWEEAQSEGDWQEEQPETVWEEEQPETSWENGTYEEQPDGDVSEESYDAYDGQDMVYCTNCGARIPADSRFCPECRAEQTFFEDAVQPEKKQKKSFEKINLKLPDMPDDPEKKKKIRLFAAIGGAGVLVLVLLLVVLSLVLKPTINLNKYLQVSVDGYNTVGKATVNFDADKFASDYGKKLNKNSQRGLGFGKKQLQEEMNQEAAYDFLNSYVSVHADRETNLSNGDIVRITWTCEDAAALQNYGYKLKYKDKEVKVSGLEEAEVFDPFEGIDVVFEGTDGSGTAEIAGKATETAAQEFSYSIDPSYDLSNGDVVTVNAYMSVEDPVSYCQQIYGKIPSATEKTYTVSGLNSYIKSASEVSADALSQMQAQAEDVYAANIAQDWDTASENRVGMSYLGTYLLVNKNPDYYSEANLLYLVYKVTVRNHISNENGSFDKTSDVYWYCRYSNLLTDGQGNTTVDIFDHDVPGDWMEIESNVSDGWYSNKSWSYRGYASLNELYSAVVTSNLESYTHEDNVTEAGSSAAGDESTAQPETQEDTSQPAADTAQTGSSDGQIFPDSSNTLLDESQISALSDTDLRYAINELYARHGYIFDTSEIQAYYESCSWYTPTTDKKDFSTDVFNSTEMKNIKALQKERKSRKG